MITDKDLTDDVLDEIIAGAKTSMEQYLALSLKAERAANRQQNSQQNITENILVTQFKPVADLYGLTSPTGGETSFTFDVVEARGFIDGGWSCQEYVELGRFQEAMLQNGNSPAQSDCCPEQNYIAPAQDGNSPVIPDGYVVVPKRLTAENFAKAALSGEFSETKFINCPECFGDDECETCDGSGRIEITVPVTWTTIKAIWVKGVEHFSSAPQQEA